MFPSRPPRRWPPLLLAIVFAGGGVAFGSKAEAKTAPQSDAIKVIHEVVFNMDATGYPRPSLAKMAEAGLTALVDSRPGLSLQVKGQTVHATLRDGGQVRVRWPPNRARAVVEAIENVAALGFPDGMPRAVTEDVARAIAASAHDPYTTYISPAESKRLHVASAREEATPGIELSPYEPTRIREVRPGSGAQRAGVAAGDTIVTIDGHLAKTLSLSQLGSYLFGPPNSKLRLKIRRRADRKVRSVTVRRSLMPEEDVSFENLPDGILYVRLAAFAPNIAQKVAQALWEFRPRGVVLDLRHNHGGLIEEGAALLDLFFSQGPLAAIKVRKGRPSRHFNATRAPTDVRVPLAILIDGASASASELVSMVVKERDRGTVLGSRSVGKGSVQELIRLPDGGYLRVTNGAYVGPRERPLPKAGMTPDLFLAPPRGRTVLEGGSPMRDAWVLSAVDVVTQSRQALAKGSRAPLFGPMP